MKEIIDSIHLPICLSLLALFDNAYSEGNRKVLNQNSYVSYSRKKTEDHWSCIAHLIAEDVLKSAVTEEKKFKNIECK